jgi:hypothetical protein
MPNGYDVATNHSLGTGSFDLASSISYLHSFHSIGETNDLLVSRGLSGSHVCVGITLMKECIEVASGYGDFLRLSFVRGFSLPNEIVEGGFLRLKVGHFEVGQRTSIA